MDDLEFFRRHLHEQTPRIVQWLLESWASIGEDEPWLALPPGLDQDHLPHLIPQLADVALRRDGKPEARRQLMWAAVEHGRQRRECGFEDHLIYTEYQLLRRTLWRYLRDAFPDVSGTVRVILNIDSAITMASAGSLLGFHRDVLEAAGRWPEGVEKVLAEYSLGD